MTTTIAIRIKRDQGPMRRQAAAKALELAGYRATTARRNGHPVRVWVR